jgi:hypothetical protein
MNEAAIASCFIHSVLGVFSLLFFLLASTSGITVLLIMKKFKKEDPIYAVIGIRLKFGIAYAAIGTLLLLVAFVLGVSKAGFLNPKALSSFILLAAGTGLPFLRPLKNEKDFRRLSIFLIVLGILSILNFTVGNFFFTSFHNYL